jgi:NAD(P)-dependent dehydrogenase (short-subunit alcohol dehydrogenase family)
VTSRAVVVTGAAGGMGSEAVKLLAGRGINVLCADRDGDALDALAERVGQVEGELLAAPGDIGDPASVEAMIGRAVERWGGLDGLFNIAGYDGAHKPMEESTIEDYDEVFRSNARGTWLTMKYTLPHLVAGGGGAIVNTGSYQSLHGRANFSAYSAAKHAVVGMTKSIALEYARRNVRANVVCPGAMDTPMIRTVFAQLGKGDLELGESMLLADTPQRRAAQPSELASVGVWLLLDAPTHLTGQVIAVDGGKDAA